MLSQIAIFLFLLGAAVSQDYSDEPTAREQQLAPAYAARQPSYNPQDVYETGRSEPYNFGFQSTDEFGTLMNRQESSDESGNVRGSYGYTDPFGVFRHVDYVADQFGFRAEVKSNEPGMGTQSPANVQIYAEAPPAGVIVERPYYHPHGHQGGQAAASGQQPSRRNPSAAASNQTPNRQAVRPTSRVQGSGSNPRTYVQPQQNAFASNALSGSQYPQTVAGQFGASSSSAQYGTSSGQYGASSGQYGASSGQYGAASGQYGATSGQYGASSGQYGATSGQYGGSSGQHGGSSGQHGGSSGQYGGYQASGSAYRSPYASGSSSSAQSTIVSPKPYDGPTYRIGNPHVTEIRASPDKEESGSILLPTVVATGGVPTLVKHIHTYPAAPAA